MPPQFRVYIVRHGETEWNKTRRIQGHLDVPLNETGLIQAMLAAETLKDVPFMRAFSSDLQRASKTAECILEYHPDVILELDVLIRERYLGELQGEIAPSKKSAPSMETTPDLMKRCLTWYSTSILEYMNEVVEAGLPIEEPFNILVVSHGAWIAALLSGLRAHGAVVCPQDVEFGRCLNTGVSIIDYTVIPSGTELALVGTLVQYSGVQHLVHEGMDIQKVNADVLEGRKKH